MRNIEIRIVDKQMLCQFIELYPHLSHLDLAVAVMKQLKQGVGEIFREKWEAESKRNEQAIVNSLSHKARGRRSISIFHDEETAQQVKQTILYVVERSRDETGDAVRFGTDTYSLTDFLVAIYFALVEQGRAVGVMQDVTKRYYEFLKESCRLDGLTSYRAFTNRFKLVRNLGKEFHQLTDEDFIHAKCIEGCMPPGKYPYWKEMVETAEVLLTNSPK